MISCSSCHILYIVMGRKTGLRLDVYISMHRNDENVAKRKKMHQFVITYDIICVSDQNLDGLGTCVY